MKPALHRPLVPLTLAATLTLALSLSACSQDDPAEFEDTTTQAVVEDTAAQEDAAAEDTTDTTDTGDTGGDDAAETDDVTQASAAAAGVDPAELGEPLATVTRPARVAGDPDATMDVSLYSLERDGKALVGIFSFTVHSDSTTAEPEWLYDYLSSQSWRPHLIDTTNLTRHDVLGGSGRYAVSDSQGSTYFLPGQTVYGYAAFASPPAEVTTMTVQLIDGTPAIQDVPVQ